MVGYTQYWLDLDFLFTHFAFSKLIKINNQNYICEGLLTWKDFLDTCQKLLHSHRLFTHDAEVGVGASFPAFCCWTWFDSVFLTPFRLLIMVSGKRLADLGYRAFSASMMLLTVYGGYLCAMRGYRYMQRQKQLKLAAENQDPEIIKDWADGLLLFAHVDISRASFLFHSSINHGEVYSS